MRVKVYFNLHKKLFSVVAMEGASKGRVIKHVSEIDLEKCSFRVQKAGRERVLLERRKNVHAYILGHTMSASIKNEMLDGEATYNPYKYSTFVDKSDNSPIKYKKYCKLISKNGRAKILTL
tara:strand:- start:2493 stop:2855 length:363 start_codon:yes stop_codon:yes gene_type:complete